MRELTEAFQNNHMIRVGSELVRLYFMLSPKLLFPQTRKHINIIWTFQEAEIHIKPCFIICT